MDQLVQELVAGNASERDLATLAPVISQAALDVHSIDPTVWRGVVTVLTTAPMGSPSPVFHRVIRAVVILARNLTQIRRDSSEEVVDALTRYLDTAVDTQWFISVVEAWTAVIAHISKFRPKNNQLAAIDEAAAKCMNGPVHSDLPLAPLMMVIANNNQSEELLKWRNICELLRVHFALVNFDELSDDAKLLVQCLYSVVSHESFDELLDSVGDDTRYKWYQLVQLLVPTTSKWTNHQLVGLLSWLKDDTIILIPKVVQSVSSSTVDEKDARTIAVLLDIISELCPFHVFRDGLIAYDIIDPLCQLLGTLHQYIKPATLKDKPSSGSPYAFPHVKSTIIEIVTHLVHGNKKAQDQVRDADGLAVILSNCIIDDNNPFIKERAITCIKFLLENNQENMAIIAGLEAQEPVGNSDVQKQLDEFKEEIKKKQKITEVTDENE